MAYTGLVLHTTTHVKVNHFNGVGDDFLIEDIQITE